MFDIRLHYHMEHALKIYEKNLYGYPHERILVILLISACTSKYKYIMCSWPDEHTENFCWCLFHAFTSRFLINYKF